MEGTLKEMRVDLFSPNQKKSSSLQLIFALSKEGAVNGRLSTFFQSGAL